MLRRHSDHQNTNLHFRPSPSALAVAKVSAALAGTQPTSKTPDLDLAIPIKSFAKRKGKEPQDPLESSNEAITKSSSKGIKLGKKSKDARINHFPLLEVLSNPLLNVEDFDQEALQMAVFNAPDPPRGDT